MNTITKESLPVGGIVIDNIDAICAALGIPPNSPFSRVTGDTIDRLDFDNHDYAVVKSGTLILHNQYGVAAYAKEHRIHAIDGKIHREYTEGPALTFNHNKSWAYYKDGQLHNEGGPAVSIDGQESYYLHGLLLEKSDFLAAKAQGLTLTKKDVGYFWVNSEGAAHREDAPAVLLHSGIKYWAKDGFIHRDDGPALTEECPTYPIFGVKGRTIVHGTDINGKNVLYGFPFNDEEFGKIKAEGLTYSLDPSAKTLNFYKNDLLHRNGGPAIYGDNFVSWYQNNLLHREDGPAYKETKTGLEEYYLFGIRFSKLNFETIKESLEFTYLSFKNRLTLFKKGTNAIHCDFGPAVISDTYCAWYKSGLLHREDGPAEFFLDEESHVMGSNFALYGRVITQDAFNRWKSLPKDSNYFLFDDQMLDIKTNTWMPIKQILISETDVPRDKLETAQIVLDSLSEEERSMFDLSYDAYKLNETKSLLAYGRAMNGVSKEGFSAIHDRMKKELYERSNVEFMNQLLSKQVNENYGISSIDPSPANYLIDGSYMAGKAKDILNQFKIEQELQRLKKKQSEEDSFSDIFSKEEREAEVRKMLAEKEQETENIVVEKNDEPESTFQVVAAAMLATLAAAAFNSKKSSKIATTKNKKASELNIYEQQQV